LRGGKIELDDVSARERRDDGDTIPGLAGARGLNERHRGVPADPLQNPHLIAARHDHAPTGPNLPCVRQRTYTLPSGKRARLTVFSA
jgi:hypothetical protein